MKEIYLKIHEKIKESSSIAIFSHCSPDGDAIGSLLALYEVVILNFQDKRVDIIDIDEIPGNLLFLSNSEKIAKDFSIDDYDLIITVDIGTLKLTGLGNDREPIFKDKFLINIDHHITNEYFGDINLVDPSKPSATAVLYDFFVFMSYKTNKNIALSLLTGIYTDTGSFVFSNVTTETFSASSNLICEGGDPNIINNEFFSSNSFEFLKLYSLVLKRLCIKDNFAISYIKESDLEKCGCSHNDLGSVVSRLNEMEDVDYVCLLSEKGNHAKCSFRTNREDLDLTKIAQNFGGGGHKKASAFKVEGAVKDTDGKIYIEKLDGENIYFT